MANDLKAPRTCGLLITFMMAALIACLATACCARFGPRRADSANPHTKSASARPDPIACKVFPAEPPALAGQSPQPCKLTELDGSVKLSNQYITVEIDIRTGVIKSVNNTPVADDQAAVSIRSGNEPPVEWRLAAGKPQEKMEVEYGRQNLTGPTAAKESTRIDCIRDFPRFEARLIYTLRPDRFWVERHVTVTAKDDQPFRVDRLDYGRLNVAGAKPNVLELGKFDRPRLVPVADGGLFGGVGFWFYSVAGDGLYFNGPDDHEYTAFAGEPWYVGVYKVEPGDPWPGWMWYKAFLERRKSENDRHPSWAHWNGGWGQWGIDLNDPDAAPYLELARRLGLRHFLFGSEGEGQGIPAYIRMAAEDPAAKKNIELCRQLGLTIGFLNSGGLGDQWANAKMMTDKFAELDRFRAAGFDAFHFDFFSTTDTLTAHRNVAAYFRASRERLAYTECHLGMADYGPQFQREVLINHPNDLEGFDISRFSSDWATFLGFRYSRAEWQRKYQYLMPESGLYYFLTHYSNWGNPRRYVDPEPTQLFYKPHAYCGIAYNLHDTVGFRESVAAASAFSPYYVFGHLDLKMPERDAAFAREWLKWVEDNNEALRPARACAETDDYCVVSKLRGNGLIYLLNYSPGEREFALDLATAGVGRHVSIRPIFPERAETFVAETSRPLTVRVRGESLAILHVNGALASLPPENHSAFPIDLRNWQPSGAGQFTASVVVPDVAKAIHTATDPTVPRELFATDQVGHMRTPHISDAEAQRAKKLVEWIGRADGVPESFQQLYGFRDKMYVETWKLVPWAYADRVWLVYRPAKPLAMKGQHPTLHVNGRPVALVPRVDYREDGDNWTCPVFYADVTPAVKFGGTNDVQLSGLAEPSPAGCFLISGGDRR